MTTLACKSALITGASRGLGSRIAEAYWNAGANLLLVARSLEALDTLKQRLSAAPVVANQSVFVLKADIADTADSERLIQTAVDKFGGLDVLVCNAAIQGPIGPVWQVDWAEWTKTIQVDLVGQVALCRAAIPTFLAACRGTIVLLSGGGASGPRPNFSAYAVAKTALVRFAEILACELEGTGINVNAVAPGAMPTQMLSEVVAAGAAQAGTKEVAAAGAALQGGPDALDRAAELAVFLATDAARGITGRLISAVWDRWDAWPQHVDELAGSDLYTLRRIAGRDRGKSWGDK